MTHFYKWEDGLDIGLGYDDICRIWMTEDMKRLRTCNIFPVLELMRDLKELEKSGSPPIKFWVLKK
ncbi:MAG: hypothetical protein CM15mP13_2460 [Pseudomonadota bacterium]|nr:MAG: hypothetical protein CM15mP13_2460 [Pseudomonadota bacterium]